MKNKLKPVEAWAIQFSDKEARSRFGCCVCHNNDDQIPLFFYKGGAERFAKEMGGKAKDVIKVIISQVPKKK